jgi:primosomal protein N'
MFGRLFWRSRSRDLIWEMQRELDILRSLKQQSSEIEDTIEKYLTWAEATMRLVLAGRCDPQELARCASHMADAISSEIMSISELLSHDETGSLKLDQYLILINDMGKKADKLCQLLPKDLCTNEGLHDFNG